MVVILTNQLSLFADNPEEASFIVTAPSGVNPEMLSETSTISARLRDSFEIAAIPFINCDYDIVYPEIASIVPGERIDFSSLKLDILIACEMVCAAICHQMNWDFLRNVVWEKTSLSSNWITPEALSMITAEEVKQMLSGYNRIERIRAEERANILRQVGMLALEHGGYLNLFFKSPDLLATKDQIRNTLLECPAFSQDPEEKKLQLLLQKLSSYEPLSQLANFCKPAIDYHLIRCFLRRGLLYWKNEYGKEFLRSVKTERKESTVGALRNRCSDIVIEISKYTDLSVSMVNQIEWYVGRSVCTEGQPDCFLENADADWLRTKFSRCPFFSTCCAKQFNSDLLKLDEPNYKGSSY